MVRIAAISGVFNWAHRDQSRPAFDQKGDPSGLDALPDWDPILPTLDGRVCYLAFDSDAWSVEKPMIGLALRRLTNFLARHGALVYIVHLPDEPDGSKNGLDDYVARHGEHAFVELVEHAEPTGSAQVVRKLQAEIQDLRRQLSEQAALLRNPDMRERDKLVALATINEAGWHQSKSATVPFAVNRERIAAAVGLKADAVGQSLKRLSDDGGLFAKHVTRTTTEDGQMRSIIKLTPRYENPAELRAAAARFAPKYGGERGGRRFACPDHPKAELVRRSTLICSECGQVVHQEETTLKLQNEVSALDSDSGQCQDPIIAASVALNLQNEVSAQPERLDNQLEPHFEGSQSTGNNPDPEFSHPPLIRTYVPQNEVSAPTTSDLDDDIFGAVGAQHQNRHVVVEETDTWML